MWDTGRGGYTPGMDRLDENLVRDTICGLELQLIDAVERQERAEVQDDPGEAARIQTEIDGLQARLADGRRGGRRPRVTFIRPEAGYSRMLQSTAPTTLPPTWRS